jgi:menaquinone-dependent protoporphyrinogen oxidase
MEHVPRILILFASVDGQVARIAERMGEILTRAGHDIERMPIDAPGLARALGACDAVVVGGAIRYGRHAGNLEPRVRAHVKEISARPNAFFSVSLSGGGPGARPETAREYIETFRERTGWHPQGTAIFGGALRYTKYNLFIRFMMRLIVGIAGGDTDTTRDYEYTDWHAVERFALEFATALEPRRAA